MMVRRGARGVRGAEAFVFIYFALSLYSAQSYRYLIARGASPLTPHFFACACLIRPVHARARAEYEFHVWDVLFCVSTICQFGWTTPFDPLGEMTTVKSAFSQPDKQALLRRELARWPYRLISSQSPRYERGKHSRLLGTRPHNSLRV